MKKLLHLFALVMAFFTVSATPALAQTATPAEVDYSALTDAVNFGTVITVMLAIGGVILGVKVAIRGWKFISRMV